MNNERLTLLRLSFILPRRQLKKLLDDKKVFRNLYTFTPSYMQNILCIPPEKAKTVYDTLHYGRFDHLITQYEQLYKVITIVDPLYPKRLKQISDPPLVLYCQGNIELLHERFLLSVVGTRKPSKFAFQKTKKILEPIIARQWGIVSGMAYGIDSMAHWLTLEKTGKTIAILGSGFHHIYPKEHLKLYNQIVERGLVLTEYPPHIAAKRYHFPERNRLISGLSLGTLVVEAKERSGTFITVDQALEQGKEVFAIPDSILLEEAKGCLTLIEEGATLVKDGKDIIAAFPVH